ncbi:haloacid dehalogenase-like hydrolase [Clostridium sp. YIM B02515]|uniref:Haloacid dehalogenase-like hydrolase n=1 Tax=Clostridium rhizosphaerae TaxID=2803861 RepID=A0ABS1T8Q3_9CLOT|nr:haloacid dehalogenase-like hydrolase [Clostridium rhizosphaerae]MBL4934744.1 haloacid dehalogenase-like hydrolase [Clostridium rhizosphaerae]
MTKRLLDCNSSDINAMDKNQILESIAASEGRVMVTEIIGAFQPILFNISNAELACSFGSDILLLNYFDVYNPIFNGIPQVENHNIVREIKKLTGRLIGINLEPVDSHEQTIGEIREISNGRKATIETAKKAYEMGVNIILLTGNPGTGVSNKEIISTLKEISKSLGDKLILAAGKMHAAGSLHEAGENIITKDDIIDFINSGADIILLPAPGTVPGITVEYIKELVTFIHSKGKLALTAIGTSQEGADSQTIRQIALMCKMTGTDLHHIGDAGYAGIAIPENIMDYSISIKGKRHTYTRMARSVNR